MKGFIFRAKRFLKKNSANILTVTACIGVAGTAILTSKATIKAIYILDTIPDEELSKKNIIANTWKCFIPPAIVGIGTIGCIVGSNALNTHMRAQLSKAYNLLSQSYFAYRDQVKEIYGEEGHNKVIDGIMKHKCENRYIYTQSFFSNDTLNFDTEDPDKIRTFYDQYSNRYYETTIAKQYEAEYHFNRNYVMGGNLSINDYYDMLGLEKIDGGDSVGFSTFYDDIYWVDFSHHTVYLDDGMEILTVDFVFGPEALPYD